MKPIAVGLLFAIFWLALAFWNYADQLAFYAMAIVSNVWIASTWIVSQRKCPTPTKMMGE